MNSGRPPTGLGIRTAWSIFGLALLIRVIHVLSIQDAPFFELMMGDAEVYDAWAKELAGGDWIGKDVFWYAPLYPYFMGLVYSLIGDGSLGLRLVQATIGAGSCGLMAAATARLFHRRAGVLAGVLLSLYAPAIYYDGLVAKPVLAIFFLTLVLWLYARLQTTSAPKRGWLWLGLAMGALILTRENTMAFAPVFVWSLWRHFQQTSVRVRLAWCLCFVVGIAAVLVPVATRNRVVGGEFHLTAANFGDNFYKGNNPNATGTYVPLKAGRANPRFEREDATALAEEAMGRPLSPSEVSGWLTDQSMQYIREQPMDWFQLSLRKLGLFWNRVEPADTEDLYTYAEQSPLLSWTDAFWNLGVLAPLALLGLLVLGLKRPVMRVLFVLGFLYTGSVVAFYIFGRYRYPVVGLLLPIAAAGLFALPRTLGSASILKRSVIAALTVGMVIACHWPLLSIPSMRALMLNNVGTTLVEQGRAPAAIKSLEEAIRLQPTFVGAHYNLGVALERGGRPADANALYLQTISLQSSHAKAHNNLGVLAATAGDPAQAAHHFRNAVHHQPGYADAHNNLGAALASMGDLKGAEAQFRLGTAGKKGAANAHIQLGQLARQQGRSAEALAHLEKALAQRPDWPPALTSLAWLLATAPDTTVRDPKRAIVLAERALAHETGQQLGALDTLAAALAADGQFKRAIQITEDLRKRLGPHMPPGMARMLGDRLRLYQQGKPYVSPR